MNDVAVFQLLLLMHFIDSSFLHSHLSLTHLSLLRQPQKPPRDRECNRNQSVACRRSRAANKSFSVVTSALEKIFVTGAAASHGHVHNSLLSYV